MPSLRCPATTTLTNGPVTFPSTSSPAYDPPSGILATANGRITPDGYPNIVSFEWDASVRTQRIYRYLQGTRNSPPPTCWPFRPTSTLIRSLPRPASRLCHRPQPDSFASWSPGRRHSSQLGWRPRGKSPAPTIVARARQQLQRLLFEPKLGAASEDQPCSTNGWREYHWFVSSAWIETTLTHQPKTGCRRTSPITTNSSPLRSMPR